MEWYNYPSIRGFKRLIFRCRFAEKLSERYFKIVASLQQQQQEEEEKKRKQQQEEGSAATATATATLDADALDMFMKE